MAKYLDYEGLSTFWAKIKTWISSAVTTNSPSTSKTVTGFSNGKVTYGNISIAESQVTGSAANTTLVDDLALKAPLASPALTGTPTAPTAATGTDTTQIATTAFVNAEIESKMAQSDAMIYKGTLAGGSTGDYGALTPAADKGWTYKVTTAGKIDGVSVEVGDMLICNTDGTAAATASNYSTIAARWDFIQGNQDGVVIGPASAVSGDVALFDGTTGKLIKDSGKTIGKSVPADAVFTDTKVTSVGNHYAPAEDSTVQLDADASGATAAWSLDVVTGVTIKRDAKGHVTGLAVDSGKIPANPNTDTKVTQNSNSEDKEFPLLAKYTNNSTNETQTAKYAAGVTVNPNKSQVTATKFKGALEGNADTASAAASGSALATAVSNANSAIQSVKAGGNALTKDANNAVDVTNVSLGQGYGTCSTAEATAAKVVTLTNYQLVKDGFVAVKFTYGLCASATLNINSKGAKSIFIHGAAATATTCKEVLAGDIAYFMYDGTQYQFLGTDRMAKAGVVSFADVGTAGTNATVQYTKGDGSTGTLMTAITNAEIEALS